MRELDGPGRDSPTTSSGDVGRRSQGNATPAASRQASACYIVVAITWLVLESAHREEDFVVPAKEAIKEMAEGEGFEPPIRFPV